MKILRVDALDKETANMIAVRDANGLLQWFPKSKVKWQTVSDKIHIELPDWLANNYIDIFVFEDE